MDNTQSQPLKLLGEKIRSIRQQKGLNLNEFAEYVGVTSAYISQIERDLIEPSLPVLRDIAKILDIEISLLFTNELPADVLITKQDERREVSLLDGNAKFQFLMPSKLANGDKPDLSFMEVTLEGKKKDHSEYAIHNSTEFALVLKGCVEYQTKKDKYRLFEGDSIYIEKEVPHLLYNPYEEEAIILAAVVSVPLRFQR